MSQEFYAFVLMPFSKEFDDVYRLGIQEASKAAGIKAERLDDQIFDSNMLDKIYKEIEKADLIIADMSGRNPNVFYEVGYADARKKLVLLLTSDSKDIPFDLLHRPHIIYGKSITNLKKELNERLNWAREEVIKRKKEPIKTNITVKNAWIDKSDHVDTAVLNFHIEFHNISETPITGINSIYFYSGPGWNIYLDEKSCKSTKAERDPFKLRHIIKPDFNAIPSQDWLPLDLTAKKVIATEWRGDERLFTYPIDGRLRIDLHTDKCCYSTELTISAIAKWDEIPF